LIARIPFEHVFHAEGGSPANVWRHRQYAQVLIAKGAIKSRLRFDAGDFCDDGVVLRQFLHVGGHPELVAGATRRQASQNQQNEYAVPKTPHYFPIVSRRQEAGTVRLENHRDLRRFSRTKKPAISRRTYSLTTTSKSLLSTVSPTLALISWTVPSQGA